MRADLRRAEHGAEVAVEKIGGARVEQQQLPQVVANRPPVHQLQHGQPDAFVEDLGGLGIVGAGEPAADVGLMRPVAAEAGKPRVGLDEDRTGDHPVGQMVAAGDVGIGENEHVLRIDPAGEILEQCPHRKAAAAGMDRDAVGLAIKRASASVMKQEKSWLWLKIGLRAVRVITQPMCLLI